MTYRKIVDHLKSLSNPEIATHSQRFFKTGKGEYGYGDRFLGIRVPIIRQSVKKYKNTPVDVAGNLLTSPFHEVRLFALLLLVYRFSRATDRKKEEIYHLYLRHTEYINNWDLVDSSAPYIVGAFLENHDRSILAELAASGLLWERRIAIMSTFFFIKKNQFDDALQIAEQLVMDKEDLIHKAVGWMLREIGKRDKAVEETFLIKYCRQMPRTMLRYAIEKFSINERQKYLKGEI